MVDEAVSIRLQLVRKMLESCSPDYTVVVSGKPVDLATYARRLADADEKMDDAEIHRLLKVTL